MQQLSGLDTLFLRFDRGNNHLHIGPVMFYAPPASGAGVPDFAEVRRLLTERLRHWDVLRRKLVEVPWQLDQPYWIEDSDFELKNHLSRRRLRKPGNTRQLCREIARFHAQPLKRTRPLWSAHMIYGLDDIDGLPPGSFAIYFKSHHALMDGATGAATIRLIHDPDDGEQRASGGHRGGGEADPSSLALLARAAVNNIRQPFRLAGVAGRALPSVLGVVKGAREKRLSGLGPRERTRFNGPIGPDRVEGFVRLDLADVKKVRRLAPGATVNDVMLSVVSGALRSYLETKGEGPERSLVAAVPVDVRSRKPRQSGGNVISGMTVSLRSDIAGPLQRLDAVHQQTIAAKAYHDELGPELATDLSDSLSPWLVALLSKPLFETGVLGKTPPIANTIVSNVPGPPRPLYFGGAEMQMIFGQGPCADGLGLFHTVSSYCDVITIGFQACAAMMPDPELYTACLRESWEGLWAKVAAD